jgi:hypothetical protein
MLDKDNFFPQYRKLVNEKAFYKIIDSRNFQEIQVIGSRKIKYVFSVTQYPDILKINDMLNLEGETYQKSTQIEWDSLM